MGRLCTICTHPQREAINNALAAGHSYRDIAGSYAVSKTALHRHWQAHVADISVSPPVAPVRVSGTVPRFGSNWLWWAVGIVAGLWVMRRAGQTLD